jgi:hypothetical protein
MGRVLEWVNVAFYSKLFLQPPNQVYYFVAVNPKIIIYFRVLSDGERPILRSCHPRKSLHQSAKSLWITGNHTSLPRTLAHIDISASGLTDKSALDSTNSFKTNAHHS